jgi:hypothetical protein
MTLISAHAIDQYIAKSKLNPTLRASNRARTRLELIVESGQEIVKTKTHRRLYANGWIIVIVKDVVVTAYKPDDNELRKRIYNLKKPYHESIK